MSLLREMRLRFLAQLEDIVPGAVQTADDLMALPPHIHDRIQEDLAIEELVASQQMETDR